MEELHTLLQLPSFSERREGDFEGLVVSQTTLSRLAEEFPEEVDVAGVADDAEHFVEGDGGVLESRVSLGVVEEAVDGTP